MSGSTKRLLITLLCCAQNFICPFNSRAYDYPYSLPTPPSSWKGQNAYIVNLQPVLKSADGTEKALDVVTSEGLPKWNCTVGNGDSLSFKYAVNKDKWVDGKWSEKSKNNVPDDVQLGTLEDFAYLRVTGPNYYDSKWKALKYLSQLVINTPGKYQSNAFFDVDSCKRAVDVDQLVSLSTFKLLASSSNEDLVDIEKQAKSASDNVTQQLVNLSSKFSSLFNESLLEDIVKDISKVSTTSESLSTALKNAKASLSTLNDNVSQLPKKSSAVTSDVIEKFEQGDYAGAQEAADGLVTHVQENISNIATNLCQSLTTALDSYNKAINEELKPDKNSLQNKIKEGSETLQTSASSTKQQTANAIALYTKAAKIAREIADSFVDDPYSDLDDEEAINVEKKAKSLEASVKKAKDSEKSINDSVENILSSLSNISQKANKIIDSASKLQNSSSDLISNIDMSIYENLAKSAKSMEDAAISFANVVKEAVNEIQPAKLSARLLRGSGSSPLDKIREAAKTQNNSSDAFAKDNKDVISNASANVSTLDNLASTVVNEAKTENNETTKLSNELTEEIKTSKASITEVIEQVKESTLRGFTHLIINGIVVKDANENS